MEDRIKIFELKDIDRLIYFEEYISKNFEEIYENRRYDRLIMGINLFFYMENKDIEEKDNQIDLFKIINGNYKKNSFKIISIFQMNNFIKKISFNFDSGLLPMKNIWKWSVENVYEYIKSGLLYNSPILIVNWNTKIKQFKDRWGYIVHMEKTENDDIFIMILKKGKKEIYNLEEWVNMRSMYKGIIYYQ